MCYILYVKLYFLVQIMRFINSWFSQKSEDKDKGCGGIITAWDKYIVIGLGNISNPQGLASKAREVTWSGWVGYIGHGQHWIPGLFTSS